MKIVRKPKPSRDSVLLSIAQPGQVIELYGNHYLRVDSVIHRSQTGQQIYAIHLMQAVPPLFDSSLLVRIVDCELHVFTE